MNTPFVKLAYCAGHGNFWTNPLKVHVTVRKVRLLDFESLFIMAFLAGVVPDVN